MRSPRIAAAPCRAALAAALVISLAPARALADDKPIAPPPSSDAEVSRRLAFIEARLASGTAASNRWWNAWYYGWMSFSAAQATLALVVKDRGFRIDLAVGAASSSLGVLPLGFFPLPSMRASAKLGLLPEATPENRRRKLDRAEHLLKESADAEALGRSWMNHALGSTVSLGFGLLLAFAYKRPVSGVINTIGGIILTEGQIWTQPTAAIADLRAYRELAGGGAAAPAPSKVSFTIFPLAGGLGVGGCF